MPDLYVTQALPNPPGKDRPPHGGPPNSQLNGEWIEFANISVRTLDLAGLRLVHQTFNTRCESGNQESLTTFSGSLDAGKSIRAHTGHGEGWWEGNILHLYLKRSNYVWNNSCGDFALLAVTNAKIDWAGYAPNPTEGRVLRRISGTNKLG